MPWRGLYWHCNFFFLTKCHIWNTLVYTFCVSYFRDTCGDLHWTDTSTSVSSISFLEPCVQTLQGVKGILDIELRYWYRVLHRKFYQIDYWVGGHFGLGKTLYEANISRDDLGNLGHDTLGHCELGSLWTWATRNLGNWELGPPGNLGHCELGPLWTLGTVAI